MEEVTEDELQLLEAMANVSRSMQEVKREREQIDADIAVLAKLNKQTVELSQQLTIAERQLNALYLPFQAAIYQMQSTNDTQTAMTPAATARWRE